METVNNIAKAAANAVWGENTSTGSTTTGTEPVSGQRGNTSVGEPYDKGNLEEPGSTTSTTGHSATGTPTTGLSSTGDSTSHGTGGASVGGLSSGIPDRSATHGSSGTAEGTHGPHSSRVANAADPTVDSDRDGSRTAGSTGGNHSSGALGGIPTHDHHTSGSTTSGVPGSSATTVAGEPHPLSGHSSRTTGTTEGSHGPHDSKVANELDPRVDSDRDGSRTVGNSNTTSSTTGHSDSASFAKNTGTAAESSSVPDNKYTERKAHDTPADTSKGQNDTRDPSNPQTNPKNNPTDVDDTTSGPNKGQELGPGPKPLVDVAREHGGDAGNTGVTTSSGDKSKAKAAESDDPNDPHAASHGEGTGEKYIKSTGLAADGGDFDVTNAGAGREADRLLEEKGIHTTKGPGGSPDDHPTSTGGADTTEKKSLKDKIKDKLHRH